MKFGTNKDSRIQLEEQEDVTLPGSPSVDNSVTPLVSPQSSFIPIDRDIIVSTTDEEVEVKPKPLVIRATVHNNDIIENGFSSSSSSPCVTPPIAVPPTYRRMMSENKPPTRCNEETSKTPQKLLSKSFDSLPAPAKLLPSKPPPLSLVPKPHPTTKDVLGGEPSSTTSISTDHSDSPSIQPRSTSCYSSTTSDVVYYFFPISNSPIDIITIYTRLASFVGNVLGVLTPKIRQGFKPSELNVELPDEVNQVRRRMTTIHQQSETMRTEFIKKVHRVSEWLNKSTVEPLYKGHQ